MQSNSASHGFSGHPYCHLYHYY